MNFKEVESFLTTIKSVLSCKIVTDKNDEINEIHILSDNSRQTKQIARDIRSALLSNFNIAVDYKIISVAQIIKNLSVNTEFRLVYDGYTNDTTSDYVKINVNLSWNDKEYSGESGGVKSEKNILKIAAMATLDAIKNSIGLECFITEDIQIHKIAGQEVIISAITHIERGDESVLVGSSIVMNNRIDSTVKSILNAINRKLCLCYKE